MSEEEKTEETVEEKLDDIEEKLDELLEDEDGDTEEVEETPWEKRKRLYKESQEN